MRTECAAVPPGFVVNVVALLVSVAGVDALGGVEQALIELSFSAGHGFGRQAESNLLADVPFTISLQLTPETLHNRTIKVYYHIIFIYR